MNQTEPMALRATGIIKRQVRAHGAPGWTTCSTSAARSPARSCSKRAPGESRGVRSSPRSRPSPPATLATTGASSSCPSPSGSAAIRCGSSRSSATSCRMRSSSRARRRRDQRVRRTRGDDAVLRVADQGIGIPADMLPKIFDLFVQAHHTIDRTRGGLGIGPHAGAAPGRAARRQRRTPPATAMGAAPRSPCACPRSPRQGRSDETAATSNGNAPPARSNRVACCWWTTTTIRARCIARAVARARPRCVCEAPDGEHALALLQQRARDRPLDVAFIDIGLPGGMDGYELARRIRSSAHGRDVRLVALTGYGFPGRPPAVKAGRIRAAPREAGGTRGVAARAQAP